MKTRGKWYGFFVLMALLLQSAAFGASLRALPPDHAPEALQPWRNWVIGDDTAFRCPLVGGQSSAYGCRWPGRLTLTVEGNTVTFRQPWQLLRQDWLPLPGDRRNWPREVSVNGAPQPVLERDGLPFLFLAAGDYDIEGIISGHERPETLTVPQETGLITLFVEDREILPLQRDNARLQLGRPAEPVAREADSLAFQIYRKLTDDLPARLTTHIRFQISGRAREISLQDMLPEGFAPTALSSDWPARLQPDGALQLQIQPGQGTVVLEARATALLVEAVARPPASLQQEVWSYEPMPSLRTTAIFPGDGAPAAIPVDPRQAGVPPEWYGLPAFAMQDGATLRIEERSRGLNVTENQRLTLQREMWLDFSGAGFFARDRIQGTMQHGWRLDVMQPFVLERADGVGGQGDANQVAWADRQLPSNAAPMPMEQALLVTYGQDETLTGVEWRRQHVTLNGGVRLAAGVSERVPVTGWQQSFDHVSTRLHLPYGYRLIAAQGADVATNTWISQWTVLDIFFAAFFALLAWKLLGIPGGIMTVLYLLLAMHEPGAPVWTLAVVLMLSLLRAALPTGRLKKLFRFSECCALLVLLGMIVAFMPEQIRSALYPQLESSMRGGSGIGLPMGGTSAAPTARYEASAEMIARPAPPPPESDAMMRKKDMSLSSVDSARDKALRQRYAQSTVTQTGGGEPGWNLGTQYRLEWSGPVGTAQTVKLIVSPPWLTRLLRLVMVLLLGGVLWKAIRTAFPSRSGNPPAHNQSVPAGSGNVVAGLVAVVAIGIALGAAAPAAQAAPEQTGYPPDEMLQALKQRLTAPPPCAPACAVIAHARIEANETRLTVLLEVHAQENTGVSIPTPLPGEQDLTLREVRIDGALSEGVLQQQGRSYIAVPRGIHRVVLTYTLHGERASLYFDPLPMSAEFIADGWQAENLYENRLSSEVLRIVRAASASPAGDAADARPATEQFPSYVHVVRELVLDLDWNVHTTVVRVAPPAGGLTANIPLLAGEHPTTADIREENGSVNVSLGYSQHSADWDARLDKQATIELTAPPLAERTEVWRVYVSPSWHLAWSGVPVTLPDSPEEQVFEFHPLPGETLRLALSQPAVVQGAVRAVDRVDLDSRIGQRAAEYTLSFRLRASQGGEHSIGVPEGFEVLSVRRNNETLNLRSRDHRLALPVSPGVQSFTVELRHLHAVGMIQHSPAFDLGIPSANVSLRMHLPEQRWLLAAFGPSVGPAVLYWGELLAALVIAFLFARTRWSSLRFHHWLLLVVGFSTFSWWALLLFALWQAAFEWRGRTSRAVEWKPFRFNMMQIGLAILGIVTLGVLISAISQGLLSTPDMGVKGYGSYGNHLAWFADKSGPILPQTSVFSLPIWIYRVAMLAWALWLAWMLIGWLRRSLAAWTRGGYWKKSGWFKKSVKTQT